MAKTVTLSPLCKPSVLFPSVSPPCSPPCACWSVPLGRECWCSTTSSIAELPWAHSSSSSSSSSLGCLQGLQLASEVGWWLDAGPEVAAET